MWFPKRKRKIKKQEALFREALEEVGLTPKDEEVSIDHQGATCHYKGERFGIIFPMRFLRLSRGLNFKKNYDYCFRGLKTPDREWVGRFVGERAQITFTDRGRKIEKDFFDATYYQEMANSRFTLCPAGDFRWTYRFLEAVMCRSIPIIESGANHPMFDGFVFFETDQLTDQLPVSSEKDIQHNYRLFLSRHTFLYYFIFDE